MSIEWHEECLKNRKSTVKRLLEELHKAHAEYFKALAECEKYERQINRAKRLGKDGFDAERFKDE